MSETEKKEDKPKQSTAAYLASLGLKGTTKKEKKRAKEDKDKKKDDKTSFTTFTVIRNKLEEQVSRITHEQKNYFEKF